MVLGQASERGFPGPVNGQATTPRTASWRKRFLLLIACWFPAFWTVTVFAERPSFLIVLAYVGVQKDCPTWPDWEWARYEQERIQWPPYRGKRKVELRIPKIPPPTNFK